MKEKLAAHIKSICAANNILVTVHSSGGRAWTKSRKIAVRPVKSFITYAIALHEIGHILGKRSGCRLERERQAWDWAKTNALMWTSVMEKAMVSRLQRYLAWAKRHKTAKVVDIL